MEDEQSIIQLELFAKELYQTTDSATRIEAEKSLVQFASTPNCLSKCQLLLDRETTPFSQLLASTTLTKLVTRSNSSLSIEQRLDIRNYVLNYLASHPKLMNYVSHSLIQLYAKITKISWFDSSKDCFLFRNVIENCHPFTSSGLTHHMFIGVHILSQQVNEMNQVCEAVVSQSFTKHRKIASSFRDLELYDIFQLGCTLLKNAYNIIKTIRFDDPEQHNFLSYTLQLILNCLSYDFIGASTDESADDTCTVQIPSTWKTIFLESSTIQLFYNLFHCLPSSLSSLILSCLVQIASIRRSLFNSVERARFLNDIIVGIIKIFQNPQELSDLTNYHEFCRLLARLKCNYQLGELVKVDNYQEFIKLVAEFTITSFQMWNFPPNSLHYLLSLWQRMVAPVPYVKASEPHLLETYTPEVFKAYIISKLDYVPIILRDGLEDPLDDHSIVIQQLEQISTIGRYEYKKTCLLLVQLFDEAVQLYYSFLPLRNQAQMDLCIQEGRLTWLIYIIGAVLGGRISFASTEEQDEMDGELVCRILKLMGETDCQLAQNGGCEKLEFALLSFFDQFRKIYVGDQVQKTSKVYKRLSEVLALSDESMVLSVYIRKIITNLKYWGKSEVITKKTLNILNDLSVGYSSVRKLVKLEEVLFLLQNHKGDHFPFLKVTYECTFSSMSSRTTFYTALGRLLLVELGEDNDKFEKFMGPIQETFEQLSNSILQINSQRYREETKRQVIGLARDLRGIAYSFNSKISYMMLFDWLFPMYSLILINALDIFAHEPCVTTPILKLYGELSQNRSQRLQFDVSSPNGILLFREISKVIVGFGTRILTLQDIPKDQLYPMKLKGISICFYMLKAGLSGNYVNFGVFGLYGDSTLDDALQIFIKLLLSINQQDLLDYPKLSQNYYAVLECLAQDHMTFISSLEPSIFLYLISTISQGLSSIDTMICTGCCAALDNIVTYLFKSITKKTTKSNPLTNGNVYLQILEQQSKIFSELLTNILNIVMFEECRNQWSMSRPLLGLILLNEEYFSKLQLEIISSQPTEKQNLMARYFENLMEGIDRSLLSKNRDRFTQNLSVFRHDINDSLNPTSSNFFANQNDMMS